MKNKANQADKINKRSTENNPAIHLSQEPTFTLKNLQNDDLIISLANARENKRARQVIEWERVRCKKLIQAT